MELKTIYEKQLEFENLIIAKTNKWGQKKLEEFTEEEKIAFSKELCLYLYQEVAEYVNAVGNYKMHKVQKDVSDRESIKGEIADIFIFAMDLALTQKISYEELIDILQKKQQKNFDRQKNNY